MNTYRELRYSSTQSQALALDEGEVSAYGLRERKTRSVAQDGPYNQSGPCAETVFIYLFICGSLNDAISSAGPAPSQVNGGSRRM